MTCVPCQCNGHSNSCNPETGVCMDCQHNTTGRDLALSLSSLVVFGLPFSIVS